MVVNGLTVLGAGFGVQLGEVVNIRLGEAAAVIDGGNLRRQWSEAGVSFFALLVAILCGLAFTVVSGVAFHLRVMFLRVVFAERNGGCER